MDDSTIKFCIKCVESNQRFLGSVTHEDKKDRAQTRTSFDENQVCSACLYYDYKKTVDWKKREEELIELLDKYRRNDGYYDVVVPGSGGKDSIFVAHTLKHKYKINQNGNQKQKRFTNKLLPSSSTTASSRTPPGTTQVRVGAG